MSSFIVNPHLPNPIVCTHTDSDIDDPGSDAVSFSHLFTAIGADVPGRDIYLFVGSDGATNGNLNAAGAVVVGGVAAVKVSPAGSTNANDISGGWFRASGVSGTSVTVTVTYSATRYNNVIFVYSVIGAAPDPVDVDSHVEVDVDTSESVSLDAVAGGLLLFGATVSGGIVGGFSSNIGTITRQNPSDGDFVAGFAEVAADVAGQAVTLGFPDGIGGNIVLPAVSLRPL